VICCHASRLCLRRRGAKIGDVDAPHCLAWAQTAPTSR
jgi:hypothetical protein